MMQKAHSPHFLISLILSLISTFSFAQPTYSWVNPSPVGLDLHAITFSDSETGWAVGKQGTVILSANGGESWRKYDLRTDQDLTDVCFVDRRHGWISGLQGSVYYTTDGGRFWGEYRLPYRHPIAAIHFMDVDSGFAVTYDGLVYETTNGGRYWEAVWGLEEGSFTDIFFVDSLRGWIVGRDGVVERTIDGGKVWTHETLPSKKNPDYAFHMHGVHFVDIYTGWAVGEEGRIVRTLNGGRVWREQVSGKETVTFLDVFFNHKKQGWAVGDGGTLLYTEDGGELWLQLPVQGDGNDPLVIHCINSSPNEGIWIGGEKAFLQKKSQANNLPWLDMTADTRKDLRQACFDGENPSAASFITSGGELLQKGATWQLKPFPEKVNFRKILTVGATDTFFLEKKDKLWVKSSENTYGWQKADLGDTKGRFYDIAFSDENNGWIIGERGLILHSEDAGASWRKVFLDTKEDLWHIQFANDQIGWIASLQGGIWRTWDAGGHWTQLITPRKTLLADIAILDKTGQKVGLITVDGMYLQTKNGGKSWKQQWLVPDNPPVRLAFRNEKEGLLLTSNNKYYYTMNGGRKWKEAEWPDFVRAKDIIFAKGKTFIIGDDGVILALRW